MTDDELLAQAPRIAKLKRATKASGVWDKEYTGQINVTFNANAMAPKVFRALAWLHRANQAELLSLWMVQELEYLDEHTDLLSEPPPLPPKVKRGRVKIEDG